MAHDKHVAEAAIYEPYWTAQSMYTPLRDPSQEPDPAQCSEVILAHFTETLGREVVGIEHDILGHGVFNVVRRCSADNFIVLFP